MLKDVVQRSVKNCPNGIFKNMKRPAPNMASGTDPNRIMKGSRKLLTAQPGRERSAPAKAKTRPKTCYLPSATGATRPCNRARNLLAESCLPHPAEISAQHRAKQRERR